MKNTRAAYATAMFFVIAMASIFQIQAQPRTFDWQNAQRQYLLFEPTDTTRPLPVMYFLHGLGDNITRCASEMRFDNLAEQYGWVIVVPQATTVQGYTMWNAGLGGNADDAGFLLALLDTLVEQGKTNPDSVFFTGFSMGGFMTHRMAIEHGDRITACAPVSGLISFPLAGNAPYGPVRMMHIHGTNDNVVGWNGGSSYFGTIGISVDSIVNYWTGWNHCNATPTVDTLPDRVNDGLLFVRHTYSGDAEFQLLEVIGGTHNWYLDADLHDIDYFDEIHKFFLGGASSLGIGRQATAPQLELWPNPNTGYLNVHISRPMKLSMYDHTGRAVLQNRFEPGTTRIDMSNMPKGLYVIIDETGSAHKILHTRTGE